MLRRNGKHECDFICVLGVVGGLGKELYVQEVAGYGEVQEAAGYMKVQEDTVYKDRASAAYLRL